MIARLEAIRQDVLDRYETERQEYKVLKFFRLAYMFSRENECLHHIFSPIHIDEYARYPLSQSATWILLKSRFPRAVRDGSLIHIDIEDPNQYEDISVHDFIPEPAHKKYIATLEREIKLHNREHSTKNKSLEEKLFRVKVGREYSAWFEHHIKFSYPILPLVRFFVCELEKMKDQAWCIYTLKIDEGTIIAVCIRRSANTLIIFPTNVELNYGALGRLSVVLMSAVDIVNRQEGRVHYDKIKLHCLPFQRCHAVHSRCSLLVRDIQILLNQPMVPNSGYKRMPVRPLTCSFWHPIMSETLTLWNSGLTVNGCDFPIQSAIPLEEIKLRISATALLDIVPLPDDAGHVFRPELLQLYRLTQFPKEFLYLAEDPKMLKKLSKTFPVSARQDAECFIRKYCAHDGKGSSVAARLEYMAQVIEIFKCASKWDCSFRPIPEHIDVYSTFIESGVYPRPPFFVPR
ncbi:hypothetical protein [Spongorhabdus nitratireducens]